MSARVRRFATAALLVVASLAAVLALVAGYVRHAAVDSDQFANRATAALRDSSVRSLIARRVTDQLVLGNAGDLLAARPLIESVVSSVVSSRAFTGAFRAGVRDVHRTVFARDQNTATLTVGDVGTVVAAGLEVLRPSLAQRVKATEKVELIRRHIGSFAGTAARAADTVRLLAWLLLLLALATAAAAIALARDRRRAVVQLGVGIAIGGVLLLVGLGIARSSVVNGANAPDAGAAIGAIWDAFLADLSTAAWIMAGSGAVVAAAAASLIRPVDVAAPLRRAYRRVATEPVRPWLKALRGVALVAAGVLFLLARDAVLRIAFALAGVYLIYAGVSAILWLVYEPPAEHAGLRHRRLRPHVAPRRRALVATGLGLLLIAVTVVIFVGSGGTSTAAPAPVACNGHEQLCNRPLDQVALPATHNSMSVPLPGWFASEQDRPIPNQLQDGIRGLLIDTHYADRLPNGRLRTEIGAASKIRRYAQRDGVSPKAVDAALRLRNRLGFSGKGKRGLYLCHTFCELGGTPLGEVLSDLHDFLVANPGAVVVVINQDYVRPADFVRAVGAAGLDPLVYRGPTTKRWPTLRRMIDSGQRVVFLAENHADEAHWYHLAYRSITEETPYNFSKPSQLTARSNWAASCRPGRGPKNDAPLFLVNHWISTDPVPRPSHAAQVNAYGPLLGRLRACARIRHHVPNLVAVNFYRRGALFRVVDTLNGVR